jgi:hypothetical protein
LDPVQALDILCRPWAFESQGGISIRLPPKAATTNSNQDKKQPPWLIKQDPWKKRRGTVQKNGKKFKYVWNEKLNDKKKVGESDWDDDDDFRDDVNKYWKAFDEKKD